MSTYIRYSPELKISVKGKKSIRKEQKFIVKPK
jgi:hypothetical protein